jgi:hypothetical protein
MLAQGFPELEVYTHAALLTFAAAAASGETSIKM